MKRFLLLVIVLIAAAPAFGWGGGHRCITQAAMELLPREDLEFLGLERAALEEIYCKFPDENWPCYGQWGGGVGDPRLPRYPDTRREWEISYYCGWAQVLRTGKSYPHAPPASAEAAAVLFPRDVAEEISNVAEGTTFRLEGFGDVATSPDLSKGDFYSGNKIYVFGAGAGALLFGFH